MASSDMALEGEVLDLSRNAFWTTAQAFTGLLAVRACTKIVLRYALRYQRRASVQITSDGLHVSLATSALGKPLQNETWHFPNLVRISRETRFPSATFYAGLLAFFVGTALGATWLLDGVRAASGSLVVLGATVFAVGVALDYAFTLLGARIPPVECVVLNWSEKDRAGRLRLRPDNVRQADEFVDALRSHFARRTADAPAQT